MSDRIAVMSGGKVLQIATPRVLYEEPNCREVADFIGTINFFDGKITAPNAIDAGPIGTMHAATTEPAGTKILLALRPEKIALSADPVAGAIAGKVVAAAYLGERSHYTIAIPGRDEPIAVSGQNAEKIVTKGHAPGDTVYLSWASDAVVILPCD